MEVCVCTKRIFSRIRWLKNFENRSTFAKVLTNIKWLPFLRHSVPFVSVCACVCTCDSYMCDCVSTVLHMALLCLASDTVVSVGCRRLLRRSSWTISSTAADRRDDAAEGSHLAVRPVDWCSYHRPRCVHPQS